MGARILSQGRKKAKAEEECGCWDLVRYGKSVRIPVALIAREGFWQGCRKRAKQRPSPLRDSYRWCVSAFSSGTYPAPGDRHYLAGRDFTST